MILGDISQWLKSLSMNCMALHIITVQKKELIEGSHKLKCGVEHVLYDLYDYSAIGDLMQLSTDGVLPTIVAKRICVGLQNNKYWKRWSPVINYCTGLFPAALCYTILSFSAYLIIVCCIIRPNNKTGYINNE